MEGNAPESRDASVVESTSYTNTTLMSAMQVSVSKHLLDAHYTMVWGNDYYKVIESQIPKKSDCFFTRAEDSGVEVST